MTTKERSTADLVAENAALRAERDRLAVEVARVRVAAEALVTVLDESSTILVADLDAARSAEDGLRAVLSQPSNASALLEERDRKSEERGARWYHDATIELDADCDTLDPTEVCRNARSRT